MTFEVRAATIADADAIGSVNVASWREAYGSFLSAEFLGAMTVSDYQSRWRRWLERDGSGTFVALVDGEVRGYSRAGIPIDENPPRDLQLYTLYVLATEYGTGAGQALLDAALGNRPAYLWVAELNPRAIAFYRRNGFEPDGEVHTEADWEDLRDLRMVR